jgi:hypothetical protein
MLDLQRPWRGITRSEIEIEIEAAASRSISLVR